MEDITRKAQIIIAAVSAENSYEILLLRTNERRGLFWQNCTGKVEDGESYLDGALREAIEETGLNDSDVSQCIELDIKHCFHDRWGRDVEEKSFLIISKCKWEISLDPTEHSDYKWIPYNLITKNDLEYSSNFEALQKAVDLLGAIKC